MTDVADPYHAPEFNADKPVFGPASHAWAAAGDAAPLALSPIVERWNGERRDADLAIVAAAFRQALGNGAPGLAWPIREAIVNSALVRLRHKWRA